MKMQFEWETNTAEDGLQYEDGSPMMTPGDIAHLESVIAGDIKAGKFKNDSDEEFKLPSGGLVEIIWHWDGKTVYVKGLLEL